MKKRNRALASATVLSLVLTSTVTATNVQAAAEVTRVPGANREATAMEVAKQAFGTAETVVLVNGYGYADAVSATPLAKALNAPILLTNKVDAPTAELKATLASLGAKKVVIIGGTGAVTSDMETALKANYTVERHGGASRYETNAAVAKKVLELTKATSGVLVNGQDGYADALSVASIAATKGMPVLFGNKNEVPAAVKTVATGLDMVAVGGAGVLPASVLSSVDAERVAEGANRFETNLAVLDHFKGDLKLENIYVAAGGATQTQFADALVASAAAAKVAAPVVLTGAGANATAVEKANDYIEKNITDKTKVTVIGGTGSVSEAIFNDIREIINPEQTGDVAVKEVKAINTKEFKITFNTPVKDTSKVKAEVKQSTNAVAVTATWNEAKTELTLSKSSNFAIGTYAVNVKNGETDLGSKEVKVTEQKIAKIEINSDKLGVTNAGSSQVGYATYKIFDQYGVDITNSALANNVQFQSGVGTVEGRKGLLTVTPVGVNLLTFTSGVVITATDTTSGVSATANLAVTSQVGTLSDITLKELTNKEGKKLTAGDVTSVFYIEYTAKDISGNETRNYDLLKSGLILQTGQKLTVSNTNVTATLVQDPADSTKGLIEVRATSAPITMDMPVVITAMTWTGKTSQIETTLQKQSELDKFTLFAPSESIAHMESKEIPFAAYDQDGKELTKFSDIDSYVKITGAKLVKNPDGTAKLMSTPQPNTGTNPVPYVITAVTNTGGYSSITVNIQKAVEADTLKLDNDVLMSIMQEANGTDVATQSIDFGYDNGGLSVVDQYGREVDMTTVDATNAKYKVVAQSDDSTIVSVNSAKNVATVGQNNIEIQANAEGSTTVRFMLVDTSVTSGAGYATAIGGTTVNGKIVDTKAQVLTVLDDADIKDYTIETVDAPIYALNVDETPTAIITGREDAYAANPEVYGTTSTGAKVVLRGKPVTGVYVSNTDDFTPVTVPTVGLAYDDVKVFAKKLQPTEKEATTNLTVTIAEADGTVHSVTTPIKSSTEAPVAKELVASIDTSFAGISKDDDVVTIDLSDVAADTNTKKFADGSYMTRFDNLTGDLGTANRSPIYFYAKDQYGTKAMQLAQIKVAAGTLTTATPEFAVGANGAITFDPVAMAAKITANGTTSTYADVTAVTTNGLVKTIRIVFVQ